MKTLYAAGDHTLSGAPAKPEIHALKYVPSAGAEAGFWWGEVLTGIRVFGWRQPFRSNAISDHLTNAQGRRGVVLVHGFVCNRGLWNPWMHRLRDAGAPYVAVNLEPVFGSIERYAALIDRAVQRVTAATGIAPIVVAHSMGGLAVRAWLRDPAQATRVHSVLTIATPHAGTALARFAFSKNTRQMRPGSPWLQALQRVEAESPRPPFTCYFSHCDNIVFPANHAMLSGATNHHVPGIAHVHLTFHPPILDDIGLPFESVTFDVQVNFALQGLDAGGPNDLRRDGADAPDACIFRRQDAAAILAQDLPVGLLADGQFLIGQKSQMLRPMARPFALFFRQT